ncbi:MAG: hypothetical protein LV481_15395 [Methylacidiphilales bacterium]|nr:hypothetical protein [Candidatus Methylacidiphilales bacterium]
MNYSLSFPRMTLLGIAFMGCLAAANATASQTTNASSPPPPKNLGHIPLPEQVPYLNTPQRYPVGNGVAMAVGEATGEWSQLAGPGYTSPNFITSEALTLEIDGVEQPLRVEMKRARETGVYYGFTVCGDLQVRLIDYACWGQPWISRLVMIDNTSGAVSHSVRIKAMVLPKAGAGMTHWLVKDADNEDCGIAIKADASVWMPSGGKNVADKSVVIAFTDPAGTAVLGSNSCTLATKLTEIAPGGSYNAALGHYFRQGAAPDDQCMAAIRAMDSVGDLEKCVTDWQLWFEHVGPGYQLGNIKDERARNLVEGALAILKTIQSQDGGLIAHATFYKDGYIRDAVLGLRGLTATGHFDESKRWLIWLDHKFALYGHIPDAASCEASLADGSTKGDMGNANVEETALVLLCARDYYHATQDLQTLNAIHPSLQYCMDVQLKEAVANGYKLEFNGDETEVCGAVNISPTGTQAGLLAQKQDWALSSVALCAASLDFYIEYLQARGEDPTSYRNTQTGATLNLKTELNHLLQAMDTDFWRTNVPELPEGFHDCFRIKSDMSWPLKRIVNLTLMPVYFGTPYPADEKAKDVSAMAHYFDEKSGFLPLVPGANGFDGHDLGYLLWSLVEVGNPKKTEVYQALVNGPTADCWGTFNEAYSGNGTRNSHDLRTLETGCNISAIAKYWDLKP